MIGHSLWVLFGCVSSVAEDDLNGVVSVWVVIGGMYFVEFRSWEMGILAPTRRNPAGAPAGYRVTHPWAPSCTPKGAIG